MAEQPEKVKFIYNKMPDYRIVTANGAFGGVTPRGTFMLHFFNEYAPPPSAEILDLDEKGEVKKSQLIREEEFGSPVHVRDLVVGVSMPPDQAVSLANFILERVKMVEDRMKKEGRGA